MRGNDKVIEVLNRARAQELHAIVQYMTHHYELEDRQYGVLSKRIKGIAIEEMKHAELLAERILFLEGEPTTKFDQAIRKGQSVREILENDRALEEGAVKDYNEFARICAESGDRASQELFEQLILQEENHLDEFETTGDRVDELGASYLARLTGSDGD